jgi:3-methyladenine DNA glycosylase AlkC
MSATRDQAPRKPARRMAEIPPEVLGQLNRGETESLNLVEWLAADQRELARHVLPTLGLAKAIEPALAAVAAIAKPTAMSQTRAIGLVLAEFVEIKSAPRAAYQRIVRHPSDVVRNWAGFIVAGTSDLTFTQRMRALEPLAADPHFGVREMAWMGMRPAIEKQLEHAIEQLATWTACDHEGLRRCASEATRPCGVWCNHLTRLKSEPKLALSILEPLKSDAHKYVRDSVGNWLNDASKSQPAWVQSLCRRWQRESKTPETAHIVAKALRTIRKS